MSEKKGKLLSGKEDRAKSAPKVGRNERDVAKAEGKGNRWLFVVQEKGGDEKCREKILSTNR